MKLEVEITIPPPPPSIKFLMGKILFLYLSQLKSLLVIFLNFLYCFLLPSCHTTTTKLNEGEEEENRNLRGEKIKIFSTRSETCGFTAGKQLDFQFLHEILDSVFVCGSSSSCRRELLIIN